MLFLFAVLSLASSVPADQKPGGSKPWEATDVPQPEEVLVGGDEHARYLLHAEKEAKEPADGWRILFVMPGGNGSAEFAPFIGRIRQHALEKEWIVVQPVAPVWDEKQADQIVWPTEKNPYPGMKFSTEKLVDAILDDLGKKRKVDPKFVYTLSWGSGGPAAYAIALAPKTRITGSLIAMSVFKKEELPTLKYGAGRRFYILHSPQDQVCPIRMAEDARDELTKAGAEVIFHACDGGHGWRDNAYDEIRSGIAWLESGAKVEEELKAKSGK